ncbi:hypothetical protein JXC34_03170 [Candidatus Woesearchaeota archaeon]|nr:hypothetical protein [Candidatus Woesearchaeota archaeon]
MKKGIIVLMLYLVLFSALFFLSMYNFMTHSSILDIGFSEKTTNLLLILLSMAGIMKSVWHIYDY